MKFKDVKSTKYGLAYFIASCAMILFSIAVIVLAILIKATWLMFVYLGVALVYALCILILEILKGKEKKEEAKEEQPVEEEQPAEEPAEEVKEEESVEEPEQEANEEAQAEEQPVEEQPIEEPVEAPKKEKAVYVPFTDRLRKADPFVIFAYNEIKSELLSYGFKSRISQKGDSFRLHRKLYCRMTVAGKSLKLYMALNPKDYENTTIPFKDVSDMKKYQDVPFVFKAKSDLSIRRAKRLIEDMAGNDGIEQKKVVERNYAKEALKR